MEGTVFHSKIHRPAVRLHYQSDFSLDSYDFVRLNNEQARFLDFLTEQARRLK
jgi:hypothetical protein